MWCDVPCDMWQDLGLPDESEDITAILMIRMV